MRPTATRNLLLVFADQMRAEALHCGGNTAVHTPNFDRLASEGTLFSNAIANCPVCTPSRAGLLTGRYPLSCRTVVNDLAMPEDEQTFAHVMGAAGCRTGYVGKWHLDGIPRSRFTPPGPRRHGFDTFWAAYNCTHAYFDARYYLDTPEPVHVDRYEPDVQTDLAIEFLEKYRNDAFCLVVSWGPPHAPYEIVPDEYRAMYDPEKLILRPNWSSEGDRRALADYYAAVTALDWNFGRLLDALDRLGLTDNTLVVFTSDHGDMLWSQGEQKKQRPWEESINIPLIMRCPGQVGEGKRSDALVGITDLAPTMLALAGFRVPEFMDGLDLSAVARGKACPEHTSVPIMDLVPVDQAPPWRAWRGVRTKRHTYARLRDRGWVLYDNLNDPYQLNNLIDDPGSSALQNELEGHLQQWLARLNDPFPTREDCLELLGLTDAFRERQEHFASGNNW